MKKINLWFTDFYDGFEPGNSYFFNHLSEHFNLVLDKEKPDFIFFSCYGSDFLTYNCVKIFYTGENLRPDFNLCDYAIGFDYIDFNNRYLRFPNFALYEEQFNQLTLEKTKLDIPKKSFFCNFIYSNSNADPARDRFFHLLNRYKKVDSPGSHLNNVSLNVGQRFASDWMFSKIEFQSSCKFSIAFENSFSPGYTTEKILHSFISRTIPIYWGNPDVGRDFNTNSFINCHDFENFDDVIERVKQIDNDPELYNVILREPPFRKNIIPENLKKETVLDFLINILEQSPEEALKRPAYGTTAKYEKNLKELNNLKHKVTVIKKRLFFK